MFDIALNNFKLLYIYTGIMYMNVHFLILSDLKLEKIKKYCGCTFDQEYLRYLVHSIQFS